jgi:hypothetical protein
MSATIDTFKTAIGFLSPLAVFPCLAMSMALSFAVPQAKLPDELFVKSPSR